MVMTVRRPTGRSKLRLGGGVLAGLLVVTLSLLTGVAAAGPQQQPDPQETLERLPAGQLPTEAEVLMSDQLEGWPIDVTFVQTDIRDVVRFFSQLTGLNIVLDPGVAGPVTVSLFSVPWDIALTTILRSHELGYTVENNVVRVASLDKLANEAQRRARLADEEQKATPLETQTVRLSYARSEDLLQLAERQLTERGEVDVDRRTNSLIIKDTPEAIQSIVGLVESLDVPAPQVMIESRIVETTKEFSRELGIQWGFQGVADSAHGNTTGLVFPNSFRVQGFNRPTTGFTAAGVGGTPFAVNLPVSEATSGVALTLGSVLDSFRLDLALSAMEREGRGKIISTPKVTAQNNVQATIESGQRIPVQTLIDNTASIQFINANLQLQVVPQITHERTIMLDITVDKSEPDFSRLVVGIPTIFTRRATTRVLVNDGGTTVIGGIFQLTVNEQQNRVPALHRIPLLGWLFQSREALQSNNELLIFITPRILER